MHGSFRLVAAIVALLVMLGPGGRVSAGTTGGLAGTVADLTSAKPVADAKVSAVSPSQAATTTTDQQGRYNFLSLAPDTYTVTVVAPGYQPFAQAGVTVMADQTQTYNFSPNKTIQEIGRTRSRSASDLVKPGQTADVYSISGQLSQNTQALGGGNLFQTFAALSSVPGVYVPQGTQTGQNTAAPYIRGGNYNQVGFEFDGIPVNRAFDNYVTNTQGITGQQELQVYNGGIPASSAGEGLSGYINQVIKTGTNPAAGTLEGVVGTPSFYHYLRGEYGGATRSRNFSYYAGLTGWSQFFRYGDQFDGGTGLGNGLGVSSFANFDAANSITIAPFGIGAVNDITTRESVLNLHFGLPHRDGLGRDEIQLLGSIGYQGFHTNDSVNDYGGYGPHGLLAAYGTAYPLTYPQSTIYNGPIFGGFSPSKIITYTYPFAPSGGPQYFDPKSGALVGQIIDPNLRGLQENNNGIFKAQYQKNIGTTAYVRLYGYTNYSNWMIYDPPYNGGLNEPFSSIGQRDYELNTHTRGVALEFADQINSRNLIQGSASFTYADVTRANNNTMSSAGYRIQLRDGNGNCYQPTEIDDKKTGKPVVLAGQLINCYAGQSLTGGYTPSNFNGTLAPIQGQALGAGAAYQVAATGRAVTFNTVTPKFGSISLSDQMSVGERLKLDLGLRFNSYIYALSDTSQQALSGGSNNLLFQNYNQEHCYNAATQTFAIADASTGFACAPGFAHTNLTNTYPSAVGSTVLEPRIGGTYTISPYDVVRFSAGKYSQPIISAYVQYNRAGDLAAYTGSNFYQYGFNTPRHDGTPQLSYNYDFSYEKRFKNAPISFTATPFFRRTQDQSQSFFLDPRTNFVSGLNVGTLRAFGFEFLGRYGDFNRDGISGQVSFAYTNSKIKYTNFKGTNTNVIDLINTALLPGYNALTSAGGGSPCYDASGAPQPASGSGCAANQTANPYYNQPLQKGLDRNGYFSPYDVLPAAASGLFAVGSSNSYEVPYTMTAILQYRKKGFRFVPTLQYDAGFRYGSPFAWQGYDPSACASVASDPATFNPSDTASCISAGGVIFRPNPYTGRYDSLGEWKSPGTLTLSAQVAKDFSKRVTGTLILTNLYRRCFKRGYAWEQGGNQACAYTTASSYVAGGPYLGNGTTTGRKYQPIQSDPFGYSPAGFGNPFSAFASLQIKL
ncbi:MAG: Plug and carboxypeptidase regulatory-like domain-containing protein [Candidatus Eremiobacteraeota bacterium]|nr:Plug and carboxypeptidase regulatory-like domain-containing protein [Candidatus Eremiobacteraeota bacterium]